jgi:tryptophan-rich sensory protein
MKLPLYDIARLLASVFLCQAAGLIGSRWTVAAVPNWYLSLAKPSFAPPAWVFGPAWIALYLLMGVALFLVWRHGLGDPRVRIAVIVFLAQLAVNASWSYFFFGLRSPLAGLVVIAILWGAIVATMVLFGRIDRTATLLLAPYLAWVSFATVLNAAILRLNR